MGAGAVAVRQTAAESYATAVQDVELLADGETAVVALRDTCRLRLFGITAARETGQINLNPMGDEHVGFVVMQLALSPDGRMLAVSTDGPRILVLRVDGAPSAIAAPLASLFRFPVLFPFSQAARRARLELAFVRGENPAFLMGLGRVEQSV